MPAIEAYDDDCRTAADVMKRAREVRQWRLQTLPPPKVIYVQQPAPEPIVKVVKPSIVEMIQAIADHYRIEQKDLLEAIELSQQAPLTRRLAEMKGMRIQKIQRAVCEVMGVGLNDMLSARRTNEVVLPRHIAMFLCKKHLAKSLPEIGRAFGGRDHTSALFAIRKIDRLSRTDPEIQKAICQVEAILEIGGHA